MIYLACPYSHPDREIVEARFHFVSKVTGYLMLQGGVVFSPITHSHIVASEWKMPTSWEFWAEQDLHILELCERLIVLGLPGWKDSIGVAAEIKHALQHRLPVELLNPDSLPSPLCDEYPGRVSPPFNLRS